MPKTRPYKRRTVIVVVLLGLGVLGLAVGGAQAAMKNILLNSPATFPVDI